MSNEPKKPAIRLDHEFYKDREKHFKEAVMPFIEALHSIHTYYNRGPELVIEGPRVTITVTRTRLPLAPEE